MNILRHAKHKPGPWGNPTARSAAVSAGPAAAMSQTNGVRNVLRLVLRTQPRSERASVLIVVLWVVFGLIAITLYFAHSMTFELRASDNRIAATEAGNAIEGARRYLTCVLSNVNQAGTLPDPAAYRAEAVPLGNAHFWIIGRAL